MAQIQIRHAEADDIKQLIAVENSCFTSDRLSARSFRNFISKSSSEVWVIGEPVVAYGVILFHRGTSLARIYSLAVHPEHRGGGLAKLLMQALENAAKSRKALFVRLEVAVDNVKAIQLYESLGYKPIRRLSHYYEDGHDGIRMEKPLHITREVPQNLPFYAQTTEFTCGPASLLMALKHIDKKTPLDKICELNIWREATTIFMTTGHGGTSPYGLALAAHKRGFKVRLWLSDGAAPFINSVRNAEKKTIIELIHEDFVKHVKAKKIPVNSFPKDLLDIRNAINRGERIIMLISTYRLNRCKEPHWIWLVHLDEEFAYFNDPNVDSDLLKTTTDSVYIPVPITEFEKMIKYGRSQYRAAILVSPIAKDSP